VESVIDKTEHALRRKFMTKAFSDKALREQEVYIDANAQRFVKAVASNTGVDGWSIAKNFTRETTWYGFDFVGDLSFGSNFGMINGEENRYVWDLLRGTSVFVYAVGGRSPSFCQILFYGSMLLTRITPGWLSPLCSNRPSSHGYPYHELPR
jgi:hypothetical protein